MPISLSSTSSSPKSLSPSPPESYSFDDIAMASQQQPHRFHDSLSTVNEASISEKSPSPRNLKTLSKETIKTPVVVVTPPLVDFKNQTVASDIQSRF